jgi:hypothetical protein
MASKKTGHLGSKVALLQHGFADESVPGFYDVCQPAFALGERLAADAARQFLRDYRNVRWLLDRQIGRLAAGGTKGSSFFRG